MCTRHASAWLPEASWPARVCTCVGANGTAHEHLGLDTGHPPAKAPRPQAVFGGWRPRRGHMAAASSHPIGQLWLRPFSTPCGPHSSSYPYHCPHPRDSVTHPCSGRRKLVGTLAEQNNLFFLLRNNVLEPRPKVTTCIGGGHAEGPGDLEQYPPLAPSLTLLTCTLERGPSLGTSRFGPRGHGPACTHKHCVMPHPWARGLDDLGWWQSLLALKSLSLFSLKAQLRCPHFAGLKAEAKGVRPGSGTLEGPPSWDSNSPPLSFHVTSGTPTEPPH